MIYRIWKKRQRACEWNGGEQREMAIFRAKRGNDEGKEEEVAALTGGGELVVVVPPKDAYKLAYIAYFVLGTGFLLPWNAYVTAVDYFGYIYPGRQVDRVFSVCYMVSGLIFILLILWWASSKKNGALNARVRINVGLSLFVVALLVVPVMDVTYIKGRVGLDPGYYTTVCATILCGIADALVQGSLMGSAGELPEAYMQAVVAGTAASGVLVSALRLITKAVLPQDAAGLRSSAMLYFAFSIVIMVICLVCYNLVNKLPVIVYYNSLKMKSQDKTLLFGYNSEASQINHEYNYSSVADEVGHSSSKMKGSLLWHVVKKIKWSCAAMILIYAVTLSIFPGYLSEDVHSDMLKDWYPILLIAAYNIFDLIGKTLTAFFMLESAALAIGGSVARLFFFPLFYACLHGPHFFRTEIPVSLLTCLLGLTNGYFTSIIMITAPKMVPLEESETAGIVLVLFLAIGLATGSVIGWSWVI